MHDTPNSDSENANHPDSAKTALRIVGSMIEELTRAPPGHDSVYSVRIHQLRVRAISLCSLWGLKAARPKHTTSSLKSGHTWKSMQPRLLGHVTRISAWIGKHGDTAFTLNNGKPKERLREMCELLGLEVIEGQAADRDPETAKDRPRPFGASLQEVAENLQRMHDALNSKKTVKLPPTINIQNVLEPFHEWLTGDKAEQAILRAIRGNVTGPGVRPHSRFTTGGATESMLQPNEVAAPLSTGAPSNPENEKPDKISAKQQLIALIERVVPDDATMCKATFRFHGKWPEALNYGQTELGDEVYEAETRPNFVWDDHCEEVIVTTRALFGRSA